MLDRRSLISWIAITIIALVISIVALVLSTSSTRASAATTPASTSKIVSLDGHWTMGKSGIPNAVMTADIKGGKIRIDVTMSGDASGLYWAGTFDTGGSNLSPFSVTSIGDMQAMSDAMFASEDSSKIFYYDNGVLSFPYSIMGVSTTVQMYRS